MNWMYEGLRGLADKEEYLTGRKIDKTFEIISKEENHIKGDLNAYEPSVPQSVFESNQNPTNSSTVTIDLATKLREDPLYEIRVKQREQRRRLLDNPLKLKKLKTILESTLTEDKHKTHKKKKKCKESDSDSSSASDKRNDRKRHRRDREYDRRDRRSGRHSDDRKNYESIRDKDSNYDKRDSDRRSGHKSRHELQDNRSGRHEYRSDERHNSSKASKTTNDPKNGSKLRAEELEKKRKEMIENAVWRECQRKTNVESYAEEEKEEIRINSSAKSAQFIKPLLKAAADSDSLEDRIKQKRFRSQRNYNSMDSNFAKK